MNAPTVVVLLVIAALLALAIRSLVKGRRSGKCVGCSEESCGGAGTVDACPATLRALADVEAKLGPAERLEHAER